MKQFILLAVLAISLSACSSEDNYIDVPVAVKVSATIGGSDLTRAHDIGWNEGDTIGIYMNDRYVNLRYTTENGDGVFTGTPMFFKNKVDPVTIIAYYPFFGNEGELPEIIETTTGAERQNPTEQPKMDFLYAIKENVTGAPANIALSFFHKMSKLTLTFINGNKGTDLSKITTCVINGLGLSGTFNPLTGECAADPDIPSADLILTPTVTDGKILMSLIIFPQTIEKVTMKMIDKEGQEYSGDLKFYNNCLESGNNYTFTVKVTRKELIIGNCEITQWNEEESESKAISE